jgi:hypothetical protein
LRRQILRYAAAFTLASLTVRASADPQCREAPLAKEALLSVVMARILESGGDPRILDDGTKALVTIDSAGCDYLVRLTFVPPKPGGFTVYRISRTRQIVDVLTGE